VAVVDSVGIGGARGVGLAVVFLLIGVAAEEGFLFEEEPILAAKKIGGGESCDASADDHDVGFASSVGTFELVAVTELVADFEVFAVNERRGGWIRFRRSDKRFLEGATGGDGAGDDELDEFTA